MHHAKWEEGQPKESENKLNFAITNETEFNVEHTFIEAYAKSTLDEVLSEPFASFNTEILQYRNI